MIASAPAQTMHEKGDRGQPRDTHPPHNRCRQGKSGDRRCCGSKENKASNAKLGLAPHKTNAGALTIGSPALDGNRCGRAGQGGTERGTPPQSSATVRITEAVGLQTRHATPPENASEFNLILKYDFKQTTARQISSLPPAAGLCGQDFFPHADRKQFVRPSPCKGTAEHGLGPSACSANDAPGVGSPITEEGSVTRDRRARGDAR